MSRFELPGSLLVLPDDPDGVCRLAEDFVRAWAVGLPEPSEAAARALDEAQDSLGLPVPAALRWFLSRLGQGHPMLGKQDPIERPENLRVVDGALVFRRENQFCASWAVRVEDLSLPDPPVVWRDGRATGPRSWLPHHDRLSLDLLEWLLGETVLGSACSANLELDEETLAAVHRLTLLPLRAKAFWAGEDLPPTRWFAMPDVLVRVYPDPWAWAAARTGEALQRLVEAVPGDWATTEDMPD